MVDRTTFLQNLIGKPYALGKSGPDEFDCYGLTRHVQRTLAGIEMAEIYFTDVTTRAQAEAMLYHPERKLWEQVDEYQVSDLNLVLMGNVDKRDFHLGTFIKDGPKGGVLHITQEAGVVYDDLMSLKASGWNYLKIFRRTVQ